MKILLSVVACLLVLFASAQVPAEAPASSSASSSAPSQQMAPGTENSEAPVYGIPDRPGWENPEGGIRLEGRDIFPNVECALPADGEGFWLFMDRPIARGERTVLAARGVRYLGVLSKNTYAMQWTGGNRAVAVASLKAITAVRGTCIAWPLDRVSSHLVTFLAAAESSATPASVTLPYPLGVHFWPWVTAAELVALIGDGAEQFRLPTDPDEEIGPDHGAEIYGTGETLLALARSPLVSSVCFTFPRFENNAASRSLARANDIIAAPLSLSGNTVIVGEWDGGAVDANHQDFGGRVTVMEPGNNSSHATHVAGTILGSGAGNAVARGFAPSATLVSYNFNGNVPNERRESRHVNRHEHDNHSWGSGGTGGYGGYNTTSRDFDTDCRDLLLLGIKSAGNDGQSSEILVQTTSGNFGYDSIDGSSGSKNILVIGSAQDNGDLSSFSGRGPTDDGRIKPDVTANGQGLMSTYPNNGYSSISGTSMSAPSTTGSVTLLTQLYRQLYPGERPLPDVMRTLLMHTVQDVFHPGPDYRFGWGLVDASAAAQLLQDDVASGRKRIVRGAVRQDEVREFKMDVPSGATELRVTMCWLDAFTGGTAAKRLIHDLDLEVFSPNQIRVWPWSLDPANPHEFAVRTKINDTDNIEQVLFENPPAGEWTVRVRGVSISDPDQPVQGFVLVSSHDLNVNRVRHIAVSSEGPFIPIPDNSAASVELSFNVTAVGVVGSIRATFEINHPRRGDVAVFLIAPDSTQVQLRVPNTSTRRDLIAVFPDLRSYDDDTLAMHARLTVGTWRLRIVDTAANNAGEIRHASLEIDVDPIPNRAPTANAGADFFAEAGTVVSLSAALSSDPDGDALTYLWSQLTGPTVSIQSPTSMVATFLAPAVTSPTEFTFRLVVSDPLGLTHQDSVMVTIVRPSPQITLVTPNPAIVSSALTIRGTGLSGATVRISGISQAVLANTDTEIIVTVNIAVPPANGQALVVQTVAGTDAVPIDVASTTGGGTGGGGTGGGGTGGGGTGGGGIGIGTDGGGGGGCALRGHSDSHWLPALGAMLALASLLWLRRRAS